MLVLLRGDEILAYNRSISKEDAKEYLSDEWFWIEGLRIEPPQHSEDEELKIYLNEDNTVRYEIEPKVNRPADYKQVVAETHEIVQTASIDNLINMDMLLAIDEKLNIIMGHLGIEQ